MVWGPAGGISSSCESEGGSRYSHECCSDRPHLCRPRFRRAVAVGLGVQPVPFLPQTERMGTVGAVHRQHPVEVIDLVLEQLGHVALELDFVGIALVILVANP